MNAENASVFFHTIKEICLTKHRKVGDGMDREKVIKELENLRDICNAKSNMAVGNGKVAWAGYANTADDALALLKEQENASKRNPVIVCPHCGKRVK